MKLEIHCQHPSVNPLVASQPRRSKQRLGHPAGTVQVVIT